MMEPVKAPWIRPGVIVHEPTEPMDELLGEFALRLKKRRFRVAGFVQISHAGSGGADEVAFRDLSTGDLVRIGADDDQASQDLAQASLRKAMREDVDLLVISRFSALEKAATRLRAIVEDGIQRGLPIITSIAGADLHKWHAFAGRSGALVGPSLDRLWQWWGPDRLYQDLALGVPDAEVLRIACGPRWMMLEGPRGCGVSYLPKSPKGLMAEIPRLCRKSLRQLAGMIHSWDPLEMAVAVAAINAHYNAYTLKAHHGNGTQQFRGFNGRVVVVGAFPGLAEILPDAQVIETDPRPGELPTVAMDTVLPGCAAAIVTSSSLINRNLPRILRLASGARVALVGPATPLTPRLYGYGVDTLGGFVVTNPHGLASAIQAGALPREFSRFGHYVHIRRGSAAPAETVCGLKADLAEFFSPGFQARTG